MTLLADGYASPRFFACLAVESIKSPGFQSDRESNISATALQEILDRTVPPVPNIHPKNLHVAIFIYLPKCIFYSLTLRETGSSRAAEEINKLDFARKVIQGNGSAAKLVQGERGPDITDPDALAKTGCRCKKQTND